MSRAINPLQTTHLRKSLVALAARAACLEIGRAWRESQIQAQAQTIAADPAASALMRTPEESAAAIKQLRELPPLSPDVAAVREEIYRGDPALWNARVDARKEGRQHA